MTDLLLRLFVKHASDTSDPAVRAGYGRLAGVTGIVCNLLLFALKLLAGTISGSVSITADAVNNLSDASGSIVTLVGFKLASRPADDEHPYGHARMEYLSGLAVAVLILVIGVELVKSSIGKILHPEAVEFSALIVVILVCSILVKLWMAVFNRKLGRRIGSAALTAAAADSRNDVISTGAVLLACIVGQHCKGYDRSPDRREAGRIARPRDRLSYDLAPQHSRHPRSDGARLRPRPPLCQRPRGA